MVRIVKKEKEKDSKNGLNLDFFVGTGIFLYSRDRRQRLDLSAEEERKFSAASAFGGFFGGGNKKKPSSSSLPPAGERVQGLPEYSMAQVNVNDSAETEGGRVWVTYRNGVYDITEFIPKHPGILKGKFDVVKLMK